MTTEPEENKDVVAKKPSLAGVLISGVGWTVAIRWSSKFLGIISLGICARILVPEDYGLVNMAMVAIGFSQVLVQFGLDASLVRNQSATESHYDTAWSLKIIQNTFIALIIFIAAPISAKIFNDSRIMSIMFAIGIAGWIGGLQNIYVVDFLKELNFRKDFLFSFLPRISSFGMSIGAVVVLKSYWGLVIGICSAEIARTVFSYILNKQRPKWTLVRWREMTGFSFFYFLDGLAQYSVYHLDRLVIGYAGGAAKVGLYGVAREVAAMPSTELVLPIGRAFMPTLATLNSDSQRQIAAIEKAICGVMMVSVPVAIGFVLISPQFIYLLFGQKWMEAVPLLMILSLSGSVSGFRSIAQNVLVVVGYIRINALMSWGYAVFVLALIYPAYLWAGLEGVCWLYTITGFGLTLLFGFVMNRKGLLVGYDVWISVARTCISAAVMYGGVTALSCYMSESMVLVLILKIISGAVIYILTLSSLWFLMGKPKSSEKIVLDLFVEKYKSWRG